MRQRKRNKKKDSVKGDKATSQSSISIKDDNLNMTGEDPATDNNKKASTHGKKDPKELLERQYCSFLDLTLFKVIPCKIDINSHNLKRCPYYHD